MGSLNLVSTTAQNIEDLGQLAPGTYKFYMSGDINYLDFQIQNEAGTKLSGNYTRNGAAEFLEVNIPDSGRYYAKVFSSLSSV